MNGAERRADILKKIQESEKPVSASKLAAFYDVSRQVVVQDIALIRAAGHEIISTNRGYILADASAAAAAIRLVRVNHTDEQLEDELNLIVDLGGTVRDVQIVHQVYGTVKGVLDIRSRRDVGVFMEELRSGVSSPLMKVTANEHYHTIEAESDETLDLIEQALREKGYLAE